MLDIGVLEEVFEVKWEEIIREWRKLAYEGLHDIFSFPNVIYLIKIKDDGKNGTCGICGGKREMLTEL
jgi:hypothetical protein